MTYSDMEAKRPARSPSGADSALREPWAASLPWLLLVALFLFILLVATDFGISTDEPINDRVGRDALKALVSELGYLDYMNHGRELAHHGPAYFMVFAGGARALLRLIPSWHLADGRHFINALTFLLGVALFYRLAKRFLPAPFAGMAAAFFASQPLLLGHGFINQKDTPFMVFFLTSVVAGMSAVDALHSRTAGEGSAASLWANLRTDWNRANRRWRQLGAATLLLALAIALEFLWLELGLRWGRGWVTNAYRGQAWQPLNELFLAIAQDANQAPLEAYLLKVSWGYWLGRLLALGTLTALVLAVGRRLLPTSFGRAGRAEWRATGRVLLAAAFFGFTISIRPIAGFVGVLVTLYWLGQLRGQRAGLLPIYWLTAAAVCYLTWPYLWEAPVSRLIESLLFTGSFNRPTVYLGEYLYSRQLPWHYAPVLASVQLTEPTMPLFLIGLVTTLRAAHKRDLDRRSLLILLLWVVVPLGALLIFKLGVYGNIRQLLFLLPPYLLVACIGIKTLLERVRRPALRWLLYLSLLAPALIGIARLHPYEYSYFNSYVGGLRRAGRLFTLDRWCTSYREAMQYVNSVAQPGDHVSALQAPLSARAFAREDIEVGLEYERPIEESDYLLTCAFFTGGYGWRRDWQRVHTVGRAGAVFSEVYLRLSPPYRP